jgi:hypothetical protein
VTRHPPSFWRAGGLTPGLTEEEILVRGAARKKRLWLEAAAFVLMALVAAMGVLIIARWLE